jgi:hypothetical protein
MAFHLFVIPASHPLTAPLLRVIRGISEVCLPFFWLPLVLSIAEIRFNGRSPSLTISRARWRTEPWLPCCLIALCCVPTAALAFAKQGGGVNNWSLPVYFLLLASLSVIRTRVHAEAGPTVASAAVVLLLSTTLCFAILAAVVELPRLAQGRLAPNQAGVIYDYCRANPGQIYFSWHPAAVLAAEGDLHHFYYALFDRDLAGHPVDPEHFSAHVPKHAKLVLIEDVVDERFFDRTFAGYERLPDGFALPVPLGGTILRRKAVPDGR